MLFLALLSCGEKHVATYVGGGSATVTLSELEGESDLSFDVPGLSDDQLDELFAEGHVPNEVYNRLNELAMDDDWAGAVMIRENDSPLVQIQDNRFDGFEPCGLPLSRAYVRVLLFMPWQDVLITDSPWTGIKVHNTVKSNEEGVHDWTGDDYSGSSSVDVDVTCPDGVLPAVLTLEWSLDPDVTRDAHERVREDDCMFCG